MSAYCSVSSPGNRRWGSVTLCSPALQRPHKISNFEHVKYASTTGRSFPKPEHVPPIRIIGSEQLGEPQALSEECAFSSLLVALASGA